jgi:hypothetical protein
MKRKTMSSAFSSLYISLSGSNPFFVTCNISQESRELSWKSSSTGKSGNFFEKRDFSAIQRNLDSADYLKEISNRLFEKGHRVPTKLLIYELYVLYDVESHVEILS